MSVEDLKSVDRSLSRGREPVVSVSSFRHITPCNVLRCEIHHVRGDLLIASFSHCSSFSSSAAVGLATCVLHRPLVEERIVRSARNEDGSLTGSYPLTASTPSRRTLSRERPFPHPGIPDGVTDRLTSLGYVCCCPARHSTGRGGYANITELGSPDIEPPIHIVHPEHELVSTGRGGVGNIRDRSQSKVRDQPEPHIPRPHPDGEIFSSGRGGAGNIRSRSQSKPPREDKVKLEFFSSLESSFRFRSVPSPPAAPHFTLTVLGSSPVLWSLTIVPAIIPPFIHQSSMIS